MGELQVFNNAEFGSVRSLRSNILGQYASLDHFIQRWSAEEKKVAIRELMNRQGIDLEQMKAEQANNVKKRDFLSKYSGAARKVLEVLLEKYMNTGVYEIEKTEILQIDPFKKFGKPSKIASYFGGKAGYYAE